MALDVQCMAIGVRRLAREQLMAQGHQQKGTLLFAATLKRTLDCLNRSAEGH